MSTSLNDHRSRRISNSNGSDPMLQVVEDQSSNDILKVPPISTSSSSSSWSPRTTHGALNLPTTSVYSSNFTHDSSPDTASCSPTHNEHSSIRRRSLSNISASSTNSLHKHNRKSTNNLEPNHKDEDPDLDLMIDVHSQISHSSPHHQQQHSSKLIVVSSSPTHRKSPSPTNSRKSTSRSSSPIHVLNMPQQSPAKHHEYISDNPTTRSSQRSPPLMPQSTTAHPFALQPLSTENSPMSNDASPQDSLPTKRSGLHLPPIRPLSTHTTPIITQTEHNSPTITQSNVQNNEAVDNEDDEHSASCDSSSTSELLRALEEDSILSPEPSDADEETPREAVYTHPEFIITPAKHIQERYFDEKIDDPFGSSRSSHTDDQSRHSFSSAHSVNDKEHVDFRDPNAPPDFEVRHLMRRRSICYYMCALYKDFRMWIWNVFEQETPTRLGKFVNLFLIFLIGLSVVFFIISTEPIFQISAFEWSMFGAEYVINIIFLIEYLLRFYSCTASASYSKWGCCCGRFRYTISFASLIDIIAIFPSLVAMNWILIACMVGKCGSSPNDVLSVRNFVILRFLRFARLGKLERHFKAVALLKNILTNKLNEISLALFVIIITTIIVSTIMWFCEGSSQPDHFGSVPRAMYFTVVTLSTLGYGDVVPKTIAGKIFTMLSAAVAISIFAVPSAILGSALLEQIELKRERKKKLQEKLARFQAKKRVFKSRQVKRAETTNKRKSKPENEEDNAFLKSDHSNDGSSEKNSVTSANGGKNTLRGDTTTDENHNIVLSVTDDKHSARNRVENSTGAGGCPLFQCPRCNYQLKFSIGLIDGDQQTVLNTAQAVGFGATMNLAPSPLKHSPSSANLEEESESAENIWRDMKKSRGSVEVKEFMRVMAKRGFQFTKKEVLDLMDSVGAKGNKINFSQFKTMMGYQDADGGPNDEAFGTFGL